MICILGQLLQEGVESWRIEHHRGLFLGIGQGVGDVIDHLRGILVVHRVMLDDDIKWWASSRMVMSWKAVNPRSREISEDRYFFPTAAQ